MGDTEPSDALEVLRKAEVAVTMEGSDVTLGELRRMLERIEARQESVISDHEARLRRVERWVYGIPPTILVAAAGVIIAVLRGGP